MKITKEQLQQIIKEELEEEMGGGMPDKAEIEEVLDDVLQNIRKNALSDDIAKQGARAEVLLSMLMGGRYAAEMYKDMFGDRGLKGTEIKMKITKSQLKQIIKEELLKEAEGITDDGVGKAVSMVDDLMKDLSGLEGYDTLWAIVYAKLTKIKKLLERGY